MTRALLAALAAMPFLASFAVAGSVIPNPVVVPEPATLGLLAAGAGAVFLARRKR